MDDDVLARNNVKVSGRGTQPMLFAHGFGCDQNMWRFVAPAFEDDYRVVTFDYVGSGRSDLGAYDAKRYASLDGYAQDVLDVCHALDLHDIIFVGHSVSSMIGVLAANREPERFAQLVMLGPSARYVNDADYVGGFERADLEGLIDMMDRNFIGWANFLAPVVMKNPERPELGAELEESFCSTDPVIARRFAEATFFADNRADAAEVRRAAERIRPHVRRTPTLGTDLDPALRRRMAEAPIDARKRALADFRQHVEMNAGFFERRCMGGRVRVTAGEAVHEGLGGVHRHIEFAPLNAIRHKSSHADLTVARDQAHPRPALKAALFGELG